MNSKTLFNYLLGIPKTIYFNLRYLEFKQAIKLPILVSHRVILKKVAGSIEIRGNIKAGMVKIGFGDVAIFDMSKLQTIWNNSGIVIFNGNTNIGPGSSLSVQGELSLGDSFIITAHSSIICYKKVSIGNNCLISWDVLIMDTDLHKISEISNPSVQINNDKPVSIGNNVWIGCRCLILKGSSIDNNCIIAANTTVCKQYTENNIILAGNPAKKIKENIEWQI